MITKGKIAQQDNQGWDGVTRTFDRRTSAGGRLSLHKTGYEVDVLTIYGDGTDYTHQAIDNATATIGTTSLATITLAPGTWTIGANTTIPANITLKIPPGAQVNVNAGYTLKVLGPLESGLYQCFGTTGTVLFGDAANDIHSRVPEIWVEWFGAVGDDSTDCTSAITSAISASGEGGTLRFGFGTFLTDNIAINYSTTQFRRVSIVGSGRPVLNTVGSSAINTYDAATVIKGNTGQTGTMIAMTTDNVTTAHGGAVKFKDFGIETTSGHTIAWRFDNYLKGTVFENLSILVHEDAKTCHGLELQDSFLINATNLTIWHGSKNGKFSAVKGENGAGTGYGFWLHNDKDGTGDSLFVPENMAVYNNIFVQGFGHNFHIGGDDNSIEQSSNLNSITFIGGAAQFAKTYGVYLGSGVECVNFIGFHIEKTGCIWNDGGSSYSDYLDNTHGVYISYNAQGARFQSCKIHANSGAVSYGAQTKAEVFVEANDIGGTQELSHVNFENCFFSNVGNYGLIVDIDNTSGNADVRHMTVRDCLFYPKENGSGVPIQMESSTVPFFGFNSINNRFGWGAKAFAGATMAYANAKDVGEPVMRNYTEVAKTAAYPIPTAAAGSVFTNEGAAAAIKFTLPAASTRYQVGRRMEFTFIKKADFQLRILPAGTDIILANGYADGGECLGPHVMVATGRTITFTSGGTEAIKKGDRIVGGTSGAMGRVFDVYVDTGSWTNGGAAGKIILSDGHGAEWQAEAIEYPDGTNVGTCVGAGAVLKQMIRLEAIAADTWMVNAITGPWETN